MSTPVQNITLVAGADFSTNRFKAVKINSTGLMVLAGAGENAVGILQDTPEINQAACVMALGISDAVYGGTIQAGQNLTADSSGRVVVAGGSDAVIGTALKGGALNEQHRILLVTRTASGTTGMAQSNSFIQIPVNLVDMDNVDVITDYTPGFAGEIVKISFITGEPAVTSGKSADISALVNATPVTGGVLGLTTVGVDARGKVVDATAITANNAFSAVDTISVTVADTITAFGEGSGILVIQLKQTA